jgi:hypothetical protein
VTIEADLFNTLKGLVGNRMYPDVAPLGATLPYIVYQQIGGTPLQFVERALPSMKNGRFQVAVWSLTRSEAAAIGVQIENAMFLATAFQAEAIGAQTATYDEETLYRGSRQDFGIWSDR